MKPVVIALQEIASYQYQHPFKRSVDQCRTALFSLNLYCVSYITAKFPVSFTLISISRKMFKEKDKDKMALELSRFYRQLGFVGITLYKLVAGTWSTEMKLCH